MPLDDTIDDNDNDDETKEPPAVATTTTPGYTLRLSAAWLGAAGVALGAYGAHGVVRPTKKEQWKTAVLYQLFHAAAILSVAALCDATSLPQPQQQEPTTASSSSSSARTPDADITEAVVKRYQRAGHCMVLGSLLFSGSIYLLCLDVGPKKILGPTTPIGGLVMMAGWAMLGA